MAIGMKIGAAHRNVRSASFLKNFLFCPPIGDMKLSLLFFYVLSATDHFQTIMEETWLCLTILSIFSVRCAISNGAGGIGALILLAQGALVCQ
jgi:hypothetical protein